MSDKNTKESVGKATLTPEEQAAQDERDSHIADYKKMSKKEINTLVNEIISNQVFTDRHLGPGADVQMVFMGLVFLNNVQRKAIANNPPGMIYAYYGRDQFPSSINGYPCFSSFCMISKEDAHVVWKKYDMLTKAMSEIMGEDSDGKPSTKQQELFE